MPIRSYRDLTPWQKAMDLVVEVHQETRGKARLEALLAGASEVGRLVLGPDKALKLG